MEIWGVVAMWAATTVIIVGLFVRIEHRLTKVETMIEVFAGRRRVCPPSSERNIQ